MKLLSSSNAKLEKSNDISSKYLTTGLSLMPDDKLCPNRHKAKCAEPCLESAGRGAMPNVKNARQNKTDLLHNDRDTFMMMLRGELAGFQLKANKKGLIPAVRLNVISDVNWFKIIKEFPKIQFYDYTKIGNRANKNIPKNYHLTFSYSEATPEYLKQLEPVWDTVHNIAVVFRGKIFPKTFKGREVINGDNHDLRFLDKQGVVVGLSAKGKAKKDFSGFVIDTIA